MLGLSRDLKSLYFFHSSAYIPFKGRKSWQRQIKLKVNSLGESVDRRSCDK